jgi:hypothetical protein
MICTGLIYLDVFIVYNAISLESKTPQIFRGVSCETRTLFDPDPSLPLTKSTFFIIVDTGKG